MFSEKDVDKSLAEVKAIAARLPGATVLTGDAATEQAIKSVHGPFVLHLATHGFYVPSQVDEEYSGRENGSLLHPWTNFATPDKSGLACPNYHEVFNSEWKVDNLSRVGVALASANQIDSKGEQDGFLLGTELFGVDLRGTHLAVLSACETGIGQIDAAEGVTSLRKALEIAGSESQVISLWNVNDIATSELMSEFYRGISVGRGTAAALRNAQVRLLTDGVHAHPFYWAAFTHWGAWSPISHSQPRRTRLAPGPQN